MSEGKRPLVVACHPRSGIKSQPRFYGCWRERTLLTTASTSSYCSSLPFFCFLLALSSSTAAYTLSGFTSSAAKYYFLRPRQHTPCLGLQAVLPSTTFFVHGSIHLVWVYKQCCQVLLSSSTAAYTLSGFTSSAAKYYFLRPRQHTPCLGLQAVLPSTTFFVHGSIHLVWVYKQCCQVLLSSSTAAYTLSGFTSSAAKYYYCTIRYCGYLSWCNGQPLVIMVTFHDVMGTFWL